MPTDRLHQQLGRLGGGGRLVALGEADEDMRPIELDDRLPEQLLDVALRLRVRALAEVDVARGVPA